MFIELTDSADNGTILVNIDHIRMLCPDEDDSKTKIMCVGDSGYSVKEQYELVREMIASAKGVFKPADFEPEVANG